ncbi:MAG: hypothetical protein PWP07_439 [Epulopiscium sp.]|jgi:hypothetical protein|nr:hypothetical protein [Defluviitaleaceae bacterium]MDK2787214.1 hypothetical protein [Candidatus Epulonipiscium sp.]
MEGLPVFREATKSKDADRYEKAMDMTDKANFQIINGGDEIEKTLKKLNEDLNEFLN